MQNVDSKNNLDLPTHRAVVDVHRFQGCLLSYTHTETVQKTSEISCPGQNIPAQGTTIWPIHSSLGVHCSDQRGLAHGFTEEYKDPPVLRRLVGLGPIPRNLSPTYRDTSSYLSGFRLASKHGEIRTGTQASFQLHRLPV